MWVTCKWFQVELHSTTKSHYKVGWSSIHNHVSVNLCGRRSTRTKSLLEVQISLCLSTLLYIYDAVWCLICTCIIHGGMFVCSVCIGSWRDGSQPRHSATRVFRQEQDSPLCRRSWWSPHENHCKDGIPCSKTCQTLIGWHLEWIIIIYVMGSRP